MKAALIVSLSLLLGLLISNCKKNITPSYNLSVTLVFPNGFTAAPMPGGVEVKLTNVQTGREIVAVTDASGKVTTLLAEGKYTIKSSFTVKANPDEYFFNGILGNYLLIKESAVNVDLVMASNSGGFVFKEIYFAGSRTPDGKTYPSDQFYEIYNNTNDTLYADKLCIGVLQQSGASPNNWVNADGSFLDDLPVIYQVWIIPGNGKDHPVYPGNSLVIAQDGINHKTDPNGNPASPVDLSKADWETYVDVAGKDVDAPGVPNLTMMYTTSTTSPDWITPVNGSAVILFRLQVNWQIYVANSANFKTSPGSTSTIKYFMVNKSNVIDAVEIVQADETKRYKRLPTILDAGYTYLEGGSYCSKSIRRKVSMIVSGRVIYKDTNNSTVDFLHDLNPTPGVNPTAPEN
jgi:hypothetical protein